MNYLKLTRIVWIFSMLLLYFQGPLQAQSATAGINDQLNGATWIAAHENVTMADSLLYNDHPAPLFRKEFSIAGKLKKGTLTITAAGYYLASINGQSIENNLLDPAWTNFSKRIYSSEYDVTSMIHAGKNVLGTILGNGFFNALPLRMFGRFNLREYLPTGEPRFIAKLRLEFSDGSVKEIVTDKDWKTSRGPILRNNVYMGEKFDANKEISGWNLPGFMDTGWSNVIPCASPGGVIIPAFFPAVKASRMIKPIGIHNSAHGIVVDFGVNLTGLYRIRLKGKPGDTITFRFGERLYDNKTLDPMTTVAGQIKRKGSGGPGSPDVVWQTDSYIFGKEREITFQPHFTFHTFRYMEISGLNYLPGKEDVEAIEFHSAVENQNQFYCSSDLLNSIQKACRQTFLNNLISVQSDCPARERFGYGGDLNATSETFIDNFNMHGFYRKTIYDWVDAMQDSIFIDTAPFVGIKYCGISWESAFFTTQYRLFQYYGDTAIINELYQKDLDWMKKVAELHPAEIIDRGLSDHESLEKVPVQLIGSTHYLDCARIMKRFAEFRHDDQNIMKFNELEKSISGKLLDQFWNEAVAGPINRQTLFATLIYYGIIPPNELQAASDSLLKAIRSAPAGHFTTGIFGTKYILEALSMTGHANEVYKIVNSTAFPGWGFMIDRGASTIWEAWKESDNTYSNCHPMFGTVSEWYFRWLAGIRPLDGYPGFKRFIIAPSFPEGLNSASAIYNTPCGDIKIDWKRDVISGIILKLTIPKGTAAEFSTSGNTQKQWKVTNVNTKVILSGNKNKTSFMLQAGNYLVN